MTPVAAPAAMPDISGRIAAIQARIQSVSRPATSATPAEKGAAAHDFAAALDRAVTQGPGSTASTGAVAAAATNATAAPTTTAPSTTAAVPKATAAPTATAVSGPRVGATDLLPQHATGTGAVTAADSVNSIANTAVTGTDVVASAKKYLGVPYVWGGETPAGLDCSGLVQLSYHDLGIDVPRVSRDQAKAGTAVASLDQAVPGDLVAFGTPVHHIGIYLGNSQMIEAPEAGKDVQISTINRTPTAIRRIIPTGGATMAAATTDDDAAITDAAITADHTPAGADPATASSQAPHPTATTLTAPPGFPDLWNDAQLRGIPRAVPLASIGVTAATTPSDGPTSVGITPAQLHAAGISDSVLEYLDDFSAARSAFNLPAGLLPAVAQAESGGDPNAVSSAGAQGLMQLMPDTAAGLGVTDPFDPQQAIAGAANLLSQDLSRFDGSIPKALAAYNAGAGAVEQYGGVPPYAETQQYVEKITDMLARLS